LLGFQVQNGGLSCNVGSLWLSKVIYWKKHGAMAAFFSESSGRMLERVGIVSAFEKSFV